MISASRLIALLGAINAIPFAIVRLDQKLLVIQVLHFSRATFFVTIVQKNFLVINEFCVSLSV